MGWSFRRILCCLSLLFDVGNPSTDISELRTREVFVRSKSALTILNTLVCPFEFFESRNALCEFLETVTDCFKGAVIGCGTVGSGAVAGATGIVRRKFEDRQPR